MNNNTNVHNDIDTSVLVKCQAIYMYIPVNDVSIKATNNAITIAVAMIV